MDVTFPWEEDQPLRTATAATVVDGRRCGRSREGAGSGRGGVREMEITSGVFYRTCSASFPDVLFVTWALFGIWKSGRKEKKRKFKIFPFNCLYSRESGEKI